MNLILAGLAALLFTTLAYSAEKPKTKIEFNKRGVEPQAYLYEMPKMCYRGVAKDVPSLIEDMMSSDESILHRDQGIQAIRFQHSLFIYNAAYFYLTTKEEEVAYEIRTNHSDLIEEWEAYEASQKSKDVLILSDLGPQGDGTELYLTVVKPCR